jgi:hypothetical protein
MLFQFANRRTPTLFSPDDLQKIPHHPAVEDIVDVLCNKTQNIDRGFFRAEVAYFLAKMASCMRATVITKDRGEIPVNIYVLALATSGFGKGHSVNIVETEFLKGFRTRFMEDTFPVISEQNLWVIANNRAVRNGTDQQEEFDKAEKEFKQAGAYPFTFDSGTPPAVKQLRHKLLMASAGSVNFQVDEIGSNLLGVSDVLTLFLELYDQGLVKEKLIKNTAENTRTEELDGKTPTNALLFGTPSKLLDGAQTEDQFYSFLETGYARRCLFGFGQHERAGETLTPEEVFKRLTQQSNVDRISKRANQFQDLADPAYFGWKMVVEDDVAIRLLSYKIDCEKAADFLAEHEDIKKAELSHRYFKALKLAGAYAFVDLSVEVEMEHIMSAIKLVEESGTAFQKILDREKTYVKLAKYIASTDTEVTHADLHEALPYYKASKGAREEMMTLATAWGYKKHIIIKKSFQDGIEFFKGETLDETNIDEIIISYSKHWAYSFLEEKVPFDQLHVLTQEDGMHFANHHFKSQHRCEENVIAGFNTIVLDIDEGVSLEVAHSLLKDYKFLSYTTKRHQTEGHGDRFRIILPINYTLQLDNEEYKEFMDAIFDWLPFKTDESYRKREKKSETFAGGVHHYNDGELFDALDFIPKTSRNEQHKSQFQKLESLDNLERWFAQRISMGNRNDNMLKYAYALVDSGMSLIDVQNQVHSFNKKLNNPLTENEIDSTIMVSVARQMQP